MLHELPEFEIVVGPHANPLMAANRAIDGCFDQVERANADVGAAPRVARAAERTVERMVGQHLQIYGDLCGVDAETASRVGPAR